MFECVFNFYRSGELQFPNDLPAEVIMDEVRFYWLEAVHEHAEGDCESDQSDSDNPMLQLCDNTVKGRLLWARYIVWCVP